MQLSSGVDPNDPEVDLIVAVALSLAEQNTLDQVELSAPIEALDVLNPKINHSKKIPFLKLGDKTWSRYRSEEKLEIYEHVRGGSVLNTQVLNYWIAAWSEGSGDLRKIYKSVPAEVLSSLVERGGGVLQAAKRDF